MGSCIIKKKSDMGLKSALASLEGQHSMQGATQAKKATWYSTLSLPRFSKVVGPLTNYPWNIFGVPSRTLAENQSKAKLASGPLRGMLL